MEDCFLLEIRKDSLEINDESEMVIVTLMEFRNLQIFIEKMGEDENREMVIVILTDFRTLHIEKRR